MRETVYRGWFTGEGLWEETQRTLLSNQKRSNDALDALESERLAKATRQEIVDSAVDGRFECVVDWVVPGLSLQSLGYSVVRVIRDRAQWENVKSEAQAARKALEAAFHSFELGKYEWGGASGSVRDHGSDIEHFVERAQRGEEFSAASVMQVLGSHVGGVPFNKVHLLEPLAIALAKCIPQLSRLKSESFKYRGLSEELDRGTRISWKDGVAGVLFDRRWPTAQEACWLAKYWETVSYHFRTAAREATSQGLHSTLYGVCNWGQSLTFYKPLTIAQDVCDAALRAELGYDDETEGDEDDDDDGEQSVVEYFAYGSHERIHPLEDLFRPISFALENRGISAKRIDPSTVDGLIPPKRPGYPRALFSADSAVEGELGVEGRKDEQSIKPIAQVWLFQLSWHPDAEMALQERDLENYRFHLEAGMHDLQHVHDEDASDKGKWVGDGSDQDLPF